MQFFSADRFARLQLATNSSHELYGH